MLLLPYDLSNPKNSIEYSELTNIKSEITSDYYVILFIKETGKPILIDQQLHYCFLEYIYSSHNLFEKQINLSKINSLKYNMVSCINGLFAVYIERRYIWEPFQNVGVTLVFSNTIENLSIFLKTHFQKILELPVQNNPKFDMYDPEERMDYYLYQIVSYLKDSKKDTEEYKNVEILFNFILNTRTEKNTINLMNNLVLVSKNITTTNGRVFIYLTEFLKYIDHKLNNFI